ncbi:hypothetical protein [Salinifilum aidingensis]
MDPHAEALIYDRGRGKAEAAHLLATLDAARKNGWELPTEVEHAAERLRAWVQETSADADERWRAVVEAEGGGTQDESGRQ